MPDLKTEISEIVTGLGMTGDATLADALWRLTPGVEHVGETQWDRLRAAYDAGDHAELFSAAWENGLAFARAADGLRRRPPRRIEWKGPHRPPGYEFVPVDLRVDLVYLVSCKYVSKVLVNASPAHVFDRALASREQRAGVDWYEQVAPVPYQWFFDKVRVELAGELALPEKVTELSPADRQALKQRCARRWPGELDDAYRVFSWQVAEASAQLWNDRLPTAQERENQLWRILRFNSAPYFILGTSPTGGRSIRLRIATPWDWRQRFKLVSFEIVPAMTTGQPQVNWSAAVLDREGGEERVVEGHVEIRWSHGRFCGHPEAKIYLDTPHDAVPGYFALT